MSKIVTRTGDGGTTGLGDNSRIAKDHPRVQAMGEVDELNSSIGLLICDTAVPAIAAALVSIQHDLFDLGGELCIPQARVIDEARLRRLDSWIEEYNAGLPPLKEFILPGGSRAAALAHVCRTVCRRAERAIVALGTQDAVNPAALQYVNRLSDLLFVLARVLNREAGVSDVLWRRAPGDEAPDVPRD